jgi:pectate lyase
VLGITVNSKKTLLGQGSAGVIKGKGLRIVGGASNIIIQNIKITVSSMVISRRYARSLTDIASSPSTPTTSGAATL